MKAIGYIRVSTSQQAKEGISLEAQRAKIKAYCELKDIKLLDVICDAAKSGSKDNREGYQQILSKCKAKEIDAVIVYSLSRFTRSTKELIDFVDTFVMKKGVVLHSLSKNLDTSSPTGRFMLKVLGAMNELEREQIGERTKSALQYKRSQGFKTGGDIPFGFDLTTEGILMENPNEQKAIKLIHELNRVKGYSLRKICVELERNGYKTKSGLTKWHPQMVDRIIKRAA